jgi:hypothetical protein
MTNSLRIQKHTVCAVIVVLLSAWLPNPCSGEFLLTMASGIYQDTSGQVKVVVSSRPGSQGLFVMAGPSIGPQEFNLESTPKGDFKHLFIKFDEEGQPPMYSQIIVGNRTYKVSGSLTLSLAGLVTMSIDNNNPYLSIVTEGSAARGKPSIVGFSGLTEVVRGSGSAAAILAANQLDPEVALVIRPYVVTENELTLNGKPVSTPTVGTFIKADSECLNPSAVVLTSAQLVQIHSSKGEEQRVRVLEQAIKESSKNSPLKGHLILKSDKSSVLLLDVAEKNVKEMHPVKGTSAKRRVCVLSEISVG